MNDDHDKFHDVLYDRDGNPVKVLKQQLGDDAYDKHGGYGFGTYDDSHGHCAFCGRLSCRGTCMGGS